MKLIKFISTPIGVLRIEEHEASIIRMEFVSEEIKNIETETSSLLEQTATQLQEYFAGMRTEFTLDLAPTGTDFQLAVWEELCRIPFGQTISYLELSERLKNPLAIRAVGAANGKNPIAIIVPCHRVIGADGTLTGYAGGLWRKEWLLKHEGSLKPDSQLYLF